MPNSPLYRIGFVASKARVIKKDGAKYDRYFSGAYKGKRTLINANPSTFDTIAEIAKVSSECAYQVKELATKVLMRSGIEETLKANWQFCYDYITYVEDRDEEVREPIAVWSEKRADCDCYATFLSALLICQGIEHYTDTVKMYHKSNFQHIFIIVPKNPRNFNPELDKNDKSKYWVLDPVVDSYNLEPKDITFKHLTKMGAPLYRISGIGNSITQANSVLTFGREFDGFGASIWENKQYIQGLGCAAERSSAQAQLLHSEFLQRLKVNLINTRNRLALTNFKNKSEILERYDRVISVWDNESLRKQELQKIEGLNGLWDKIKEVGSDVGDAAKKALEEAQKAADEVGKKIKEGAEAVKNKAEQFAEFLKKINPIGIAGRNTIFQVFRNNSGGSASRLKWAYASPEIFVLNGQPLANQAKYKEKLADIQKIVRAMGGTDMELQSAVMAGDSLPQRPSAAFSIPIPESDKKQILEAMTGVLKNEFQSTQENPAIAVNPDAFTDNSKVINVGPVQTGGGIVASSGTLVSSGQETLVRREATDTYVRPVSILPSSFVGSGGAINANLVSTGLPVFSISGTLKGIDESIKDIWDKIWEFIKELGDDIGQFCKDFGEKAVQFIKVSALALPRAFFLLLLKFNVDGLATAIALEPENYEDQWVSKFGGERSAFKNALQEGIKKGPFVTRLLSPLSKYITNQASVNKKLTGVYRNRYNSILSGTEDEDNTSTNDVLITAGAKAAEAYAQAQKDNKDLKATLVAVCTAVGTAIGAACGGYGAILGAPIGAAVGGLISLIIGIPKIPQPNNDGSLTKETTTNPDGTKTTVTKDKDGNVIDSQTTDKDGNTIDPNTPARDKKSNAFAWITGGLLAAKLLFTSGALAGIKTEPSTENSKPDTKADNLSGTHIKQITI
ncbi:MAG TPA: hypothetical protein VGF79_08765 [Bacteroidia bacterium]